MNSDPAHWAENLRSMAQRVLASDPIDPAAPEPLRRAFVETFRDEMMARPSMVTPLLGDLLELTPGQPPAHSGGDDAIWWALYTGEAPAGISRRELSGPLLHDPEDQTSIEVRTERELSALHALSEIAIRTRDASLARRCADAACWHLRELQPDNATNHPWAIQAFIRLAHTEEAPAIRAAALVHAQTQLHSCQVAMGRPDRLSACILLHAARSLERAPIGVL